MVVRFLDYCWRNKTLSLPVPNSHHWEMDVTNNTLSEGVGAPKNERTINLEHAFFSRQYARNHGYFLCIAAQSDKKKTVPVTHVFAEPQSAEQLEFEDLEYQGMVIEGGLNTRLNHKHLIGQGFCETCVYEKRFGEMPHRTKEQPRKKVFKPKRFRS